VPDDDPGELQTRVETAVRDHYETTENFDRRRSMNQYSTSPTPHRTLVTHFTWAADATVLDVGCGDGVWSAAAAARTPEGAVVGIDLSLGMLRAARERDARVHTAQANANTLPFASDSVDVLLAPWMLYHVDLGLALPEFARVLRPGGRFIATTNDRELLPGLEAVALDAAREVAGSEVPSPLGYLRFNVDNAAELLAPVFPNVQPEVHEMRAEFPVAAPMLSFVESLRSPARARLGDGFDFDAFLAALERRLNAMLRDGPIVITRHIGFFMATR
jgi:SAM-dependent methyltransferase